MHPRPNVTAVVDAADDPAALLERVARHAQLRVTTTASQLRAALPETDVLLVVDFRTTLVREAWSPPARLRWVHATSAGVDAVAFPGLAHSGVVVTNASGVFDEPIAEWVAGVMLLFAKDLPATLALQQQRRWLHRETERLAGTRALVVGAGGVGRAIGRLARALGVRVTGVARRARDADPDFGEVHAVEDLDGLLGEADWVVLALPLTAATRRVVGAAQLARMRPTARLVNVGRGELVDEPALVAALREGRIAGAALDVFEAEPLAPDHPLWGLPNVLVSPHMSGDFAGWREALAVQFLHNLERWIAGEPLENLVDLRSYLTSPEGGT